MNPSIVGNTTYKQNGLDVVYADKALASFKTFIVSLRFPFTFDLAEAFFAKFMADDLNRPVPGVSSTASVCTDNSLALVSESGSLANLAVLARELGRSLGSVYDGQAFSLNGVAQLPCPASDNFAMSSNWNFDLASIRNINSFSTCSIRQFKAFILNAQLNGLSTQASLCLGNVPASSPLEQAALRSSSKSVWTVDEQCKYIFGQNASYCAVNLIP